MKFVDQNLIFKTILYRIMGSAIIGLISFIVTDRVGVSLIIGVSELFFKLIFYYVYELIWRKITGMIERKIDIV